MEAAIPGTNHMTPMTSHPALTFPTPQGESQAPVVSATAPPVIRKDRLYVGNLHPTVDEYTLLQIFSKCGKISRMDYLFHKSGPSKGKPRGYAFIEYSNPEDANKALAALHNRVVRGRKLVVTFATQTPYPESSSSSLSSTTRTGPRRHASEASRPTALSLIKTHARPENTQAKIAALEAKLKQMQAPPGGEGDSAKGLGSLPKKPPAPHRR